MITKLGLIACIAILGMSQAGAATLVGTTTDASGIDGVVIDGVTYDVTFVRDSYNNVYASNPNTFLNSAEIGDATAALINALESLDVTSLVGFTTPNFFATLDAAIPQSILPSGNVDSEMASCPTDANGICSSSTWGVATRSTDPTDANPVGGSQFDQLDYAVFTPVTATPLPAALPLFATGLGAMGLLGWRRKRKNTAAIAA